MTASFYIVAGYMLLLVLLSLYTTTIIKNKDTRSFLFADNRLPWYLVSVMTAGLAVGGASTVGIAQNAYKLGLSSGWYTASSGAGALVFAFLILHKLKQTNVVTVSELFFKVFGNRDGLIVVLIQIIVLFGINALQIIAGGAILAALLPGIFTFMTGMLCSLVLFVLVALLGGYFAATICNLVNVIAIVLGLVIGVVASVSKFGGFETINSALPAGDHWYSFTSGVGLSVIFGWLIIMMLNSPPNQAYFQVSVASIDYQNAKKGMIGAAIIMLPIGFLSAIFGIVAASQFPGLESSAMALPKVVMSLSPIIAGIILSGLWAADISTATGILVGVSTIITKDVVPLIIKKKIEEKNLVIFSRVIIVVFAVFGFIVALNISSILGFLMQLSTLFVPYALLIIGVFYFAKHMKKSTCLLTVLTGVIILILWTLLPQIRIVSQVIYFILPACIIVMALCSKLDKNEANIQMLYDCTIDPSDHHN